MTEPTQQNLIQSTDLDLTDDEKRLFSVLLQELSASRRDLFDSLTPAQREQAMLLLKQRVQGASKKAVLDQIWEMDYEVRPISVEKFINDPYYVGKWYVENLYSGWRDEVITVINSGTIEWTLAGAIGIGKTTAALLALLYKIYVLTCMRDPCGFYGTTSITFTLFSITKELSSVVEANMLATRVKESKYFTELLGISEEKDISKSRTVAFRFPKKISFVFGCLAGETKIPLLDGTEHEIQDLVGKEFYVYSFDIENRKIVPGKALAVPTGVKQTYRVTLDNGESTRASADHLWLLHTGEYKKTSELKPGDSLLPLYRSVSKGYEMCMDQDNYGHWFSTHSLVAKKVAFNEKPTDPRARGKNCGLVIHHRNFNARDNTPDNLQWMDWDDHAYYHARLTALTPRTDKQREASRRNINNARIAGKVVTLAQSDPERLKRIASNVGKKVMGRNWKNQDWVDKIVPILRANSKKTKRKTLVSDKKRKSSIANLKAWRESIGEVAFKEELRRRREPALTEYWGKEENRKKQATVISKTFLNPEMLERKAAGIKAYWANPENRKKQSERAKASNAARAAKNKKANHKVVSIVVDEEAFCYDLQVDEYHNFALSAGVFVHNSQGTHAIGQDVYGGILDEVNFTKGADQKQAKVLYATVKRRIESRFMSETGHIPGLLCVASSANTEADFTAEHSKGSTTGRVHVSAFSQYDPRIKEYKGPKFRVLVGDQMRTSKLLDEVRLADGRVVVTPIEGAEIPAGARVEEVPAVFYDTFERDVEGGLRDISGISIFSSSVFFPSRDKLYAANDPTRTHPFALSEPILSLDNDDITLESIFQKEKLFRLIDPYQKIWQAIVNPGSSRFIHVDLAKTADCVGLACSHLYGFKKIDRLDPEGKIQTTEIPVIYIDFMLRIFPPKGSEIDFTKIASFIFYLQSLGFPLGGVSADSYQSTHLLQIFKKLKIEAKEISMDKSPKPYETLKSGIMSGTVLYYEYAPFLQEMSALQKDFKKSPPKIDHPPNGRKDVADAVCGSAFACIESEHTKSRLAEMQMAQELLAKREASVVQPASTANNWLVNDYHLT